MVGGWEESFWFVFFGSLVKRGGYGELGWWRSGVYGILLFGVFFYSFVFRIVFKVIEVLDRFGVGGYNF